MEIIFPKDRKIKAFAIELNNNFTILVKKIENGDFLAQKLTSQKVKSLVILKYLFY